MFKNPSFIFDILCTVVWLVLAVRYARKGFLASVVQLTGSLISLFGARAFSGWAAGQVFERFLAGSFRDQIAANIAAGGAVSLDGIAQRYAGFLPEAFRASIVDACERSISAVLNDNAVVLADTIVQKVGRGRHCQPCGHLSGALRGLGAHCDHRRQPHHAQRHGDERQPLL